MGRSSLRRLLIPLVPIVVQKIGLFFLRTWLPLESVKKGATTPATYVADTSLQKKVEQHGQDVCGIVKEMLSA